MATQEQDIRAAEKRYDKGLEAFNEGKLDTATEAFGDAEVRFRLTGDYKRAGDSRMMIADVQRQLKQFEQATNSYQRARNHYRQASRPLSEARAVLSLGHIERQQAHLDLATQAYEDAQALYLTQGNAQGQGNVSMAMGHILLQLGKIDQAIQTYRQSIDLYVQAQDNINEADARRGAADILRMLGRYEEAWTDYTRSLEVYHQRHDSFGEVDTLVGLGHLAIDRQNLEQAGDTFAEALTLAQTIEYELGIADCNLGLAKISFLMNRVDQALASAQLALEKYLAQQNALGTASANSLLALIYLRRGQPGYANSLMDRALRTYKATAYRIKQPEAALGLGQILLQLGFLGRARDAFYEARREATALQNSTVDQQALLGLGDLSYQRGQLDQAQQAYDEALARSTSAQDPHQHQIMVATETRLARLAILTGAFSQAENHLARLKKVLAADNTLSPDLSIQLHQVEGQLSLAQGNPVRATAQFEQARTMAERVQEPLMAAEALLGLANARLAAEERETAQKVFLEAGKQFVTLENTRGDGWSMLGVAETLIGGQQWGEAIEDLEGALLRFQQVDDQLGLADAQLALGLAQRGKDEFDKALEHFNQALNLYLAQHQPLGEADTRYERASIFLIRNDLSQALSELMLAVALVEQVMQAYSTSELRTRFLRQYTELYAQRAITLVRLNQENEARNSLQSFIKLVSSKELKTYMQTFENSIPTESEDLPADVLLDNQNLLKRLRQLRKSL